VAARETGDTGKRIVQADWREISRNEQGREGKKLRVIEIAPRRRPF
jgi:hypothetical protein